MRQDTVYAHLQVVFLRNFLDHILLDAAKEMSEIKDRFEKGEAEEQEDQEVAIDYPLFRVKFGLHAVYYELNALVEKHLQDKVKPLFSAHKAGVKWKTVDELPFREIIKILKEHFGDLNEVLPDWEAYQRLRKAVNALKHSQGKRKPADRKLTNDHKSALIWQPTVDEAQEYFKVIPPIIDAISGLQKMRGNN